MRLTFQSRLSALPAAALAKGFTRAKETDIAEILDTLTALGRAHRGDTEGTYLR